MYGAALGDMIGRPYEWHNIKTKEFPLFSRYSGFTDDTVMTAAVAEALLQICRDYPQEEWTQEARRQTFSDIIAGAMKKWGFRYPDAGYGGRFRQWLRYGTEPYHSWGNGSAMRTSAAAWLFEDLETVRYFAALQAAVTHDHPEGIKGAEAYYGVPAALRETCRGRLPADLREALDAVETA